MVRNCGQSTEPALPAARRRQRTFPPASGTPSLLVIHILLTSSVGTAASQRTPVSPFSPLPLLAPHSPLHSPGPASVLSCPHRITYPFSQGLARLIAPKARCKGSAAPSELGPPTHELEKLVGARKEMFFHAEGGICYAGTFVGTDVGDMSREEYVALPKAVRPPFSS